MTLYKDCNSFANFCTFFCNPSLQSHYMKSSRSTSTNCYTFLETSHKPLQGLQLICKFLQIFLQTLSISINIISMCSTYLETSCDPPPELQLIQNFFANFWQPYFAITYSLSISYPSEACLGEGLKVTCPSTLIATLSTPV